MEQAGTCATNTTNESDIDTHQGYCGSLLYDICIGCCLEPPCLWFAPLPMLASTCFRPWQTQRKIPLLSIGCPPGSTRHRQCLDCRKCDHYLLQLWLCVQIWICYCSGDQKRAKALIPFVLLGGANVATRVELNGLWKVQVQMKSALLGIWAAPWVDPTLHGESRELGLSKKYKQSKTMHCVTMRKTRGGGGIIHLIHLRYNSVTDIE